MSKWHSRRAWPCETCGAMTPRRTCSAHVPDRRARRQSNADRRATYLARVRPDYPAPPRGDDRQAATQAADTVEYARTETDR